ncbi:MAG: aldo/keto reductase [Pseudomonadota bacterium]
MAETITLWNGKTIPRIGIGTWVMGGEMYWDGAPIGWSNVDDGKSLTALHAAFEMGVRFIDTAAIYGGGHSEEIVGRALKDSAIDRSEFVVATKFGHPFEGRHAKGERADPDYVRQAVEESRIRLGVDQIDLMQFHLDGFDKEEAKATFDTLDELRDAGVIGAFGWSTNDLGNAVAYANRPGFVGAQHDMNIFRRADDVLAATAQADILSIIRQPLAMGLLSGKYTGSQVTFGAGDIRAAGADWMIYFDEDGQPLPAMLEMLEKLRAIVTEGGRSPAQGALGWVLATAPHALPIPGCRNVKQVHDNMSVIEQGALSEDQIKRIDSVMKDMPPMEA